MEKLDSRVSFSDASNLVVWIYAFLLCVLLIFSLSLSLSRSLSLFCSFCECKNKLETTWNPQLKFAREASELPKYIKHNPL